MQIFRRELLWGRSRSWAGNRVNQGLGSAGPGSTGRGFSEDQAQSTSVCHGNQRSGQREWWLRGRDPSSLPQTLSRDFAARLFPERAWWPTVESFRWTQPSRKMQPSLLAGRCPSALVASLFGSGSPQPMASHRSAASLSTSSSVAASNKLMMSSNQIATVINVSVEAENTLYKDIQYVQVPVAKAPITGLCDFPGPMAERTHRVEVSLWLCLATSGNTSHHPAGYPCLGEAVPATILPSNGFREQLIHYESQLFGKHTAHIVNSLMGVIPDVYEKEVCLTAAKQGAILTSPGSGAGRRGSAVDATPRSEPEHSTLVDNRKSDDGFYKGKKKGRVAAGFNLIIRIFEE